MHRITLASLFCFALAAPAKAENSQLHSAAYHGQVVLVRLLVANGANVNVRNEHGWTPLHAAAAGGYPVTINALLNREAYINAEDRNGWTPLHEAAYEGHSAAIEALIRRGRTSMRATQT